MNRNFMQPTVITIARKTIITSYSMDDDDSDFVFRFTELVVILVFAKFTHQTK